jgi:plastocyanin
MHFSKYTLAVAALASSVFAQNVKVHVVKVSGTTNMLTFSPNKLTAAMGEMVQFQFGVGNHTVTQSTFDGPCVPISNKTGVAGVHSGFMPVAANAVNVPTYTIPITSTAPMWLYCAQGKHCQSGMVMVINEK